MPRPGTPRAKSRILDISRMVGVSASTVSKVLGRHADRYHIRDDTRERILAAAQALGYEADPVRRSIATRRSHEIGFIYTTVSPLYDAVYEPVRDQLSRQVASYGCLLSYFPIRDWSDLRQCLASHALDGCILTPPLPVGTPEALQAWSMPMVVLNARSTLPIPHVITDDLQGMTQLMEHLRDLGHRMICYADIPNRQTNHYSEALRREAYQKAMAGIGAPPLECAGTADHVLDFMRTYRCTALVTYNEELAVQLIPAIRRRGISVPREMSLACATDVLIASLVDPSWTTVEVPMATMATRAIDELMALVDGRKPLTAEVHQIPQRIVIRASTAPPPG